MERESLNVGDEVRCPHCRRWHRLIQKHSDGTEAAVRMLYFECRGHFYFGGFVGAGSRYPTRSENNAQ